MLGTERTFLGTTIPIIPVNYPWFWRVRHSITNIIPTLTPKSCLKPFVTKSTSSWTAKIWRWISSFLTWHESHRWKWLQGGHFGVQVVLWHCLRTTRISRRGMHALTFSRKSMGTTPCYSRSIVRTRCYSRRGSLKTSRSALNSSKFMLEAQVPINHCISIFKVVVFFG